MIVSVHLADVGLRAAPVVLRKPLRPATVLGLTYATTVTAAPLGESLLPSPRFGRVGMIAAWDDDAALDEFSASHPAAERFAGGWQVRLQPLRVFGSWAEMPDLPATPLPVEDGEPVAILTLGRLRLNRILPFLRSSAAAEGAAVGDPALLASTGLARPPHLVSTFSLWRSAAEMREYAAGQSGAHQGAVRADRERAYHHESAFVRFRPYASQGNWDGRDPLAGLVGARRA
jgi:hypothetical protein